MSTADAQDLGAAQTKAAAPSGTGMIIRQKEPVNFEFPFEKLDSFLTPNDLFYIRSHFNAPELNRDSYQLRVQGTVETDLSFTYEQLLALPSKTVTATLECAGNSRVFLVPQVEGAQWGLGAVGNAEWTGVPLRLLLDQAGPKSQACEVVFEGADQGTPKEKPIPPGPVTYARSLPLAKAMEEEVLVAYRMNGEELSQDHGYPVRLIVPGHYGMASVKWLTCIQVVDQPFQGYWQTSDYAYWGYLNGKPVRRPLSEIMLKSQVARPKMYEVVEAGTDYVVTGAAWCGNAAVSEVEVTTDGGQYWTAAQFLDLAQPYAWRRWQFLWRVPQQPSRCILASRARDANGAVQPEKHNPNYGSYIINYPVPIDVIVR